MSGVLRFKKHEIHRLLDLSKAADSHRTLYEMPGTAAPGLWLVGDHGVYLMTNEVLTEGGKPAGVTYSIDCDPNNMQFDDWWEAKRNTFGGDDGVEFLPAHVWEPLLKSTAPYIVIEFDGDQLSIHA